MEFHFQVQQKLARTFANMISRCYDSNSPSYYWYGARGIKICDEWLQDLSAFASHMGAPPTLDHSIERIDNNGNYEPDNCRWATKEEQNNNTRRTKLIEWKGKIQSVRDWAKEYNIGSRRLHERLSRGWSMERALNTPCPLGFECDLAKRRRDNAILWKSKGRLYQAHSKQRRGHKLSKNEQKNIEAKQEELAIQAKINAEINAELSVEIESASKLMPSILDLHEGGVSVKRISQHFNIPLTIVNLVIKRNDRQFFVDSLSEEAESVTAQVASAGRKKHQRISAEEMQKVLGMRQNGATFRAIAKIVGCSKSAAQLIIKHNLQTQPAL